MYTFSYRDHGMNIPNVTRLVGAPTVAGSKGWMAGCILSRAAESKMEVRVEDPVLRIKEKGEAMKRQLLVLMATFGVLLAAAPAFAHHAFAAEYDANKPITLTGSLVKVEWVNPHGWIYLD